MMKISLFFKPSIIRVSFALILSLAIVGLPGRAHADFLSVLLGTSAQAAQVAPLPATPTMNSQTMPLLGSTASPEPSTVSGDLSGQAVTIVGDQALATDTPLVGTDTIDKEYASSAEITTYTVVKGDTIQKVANKFGISKDTIIQSNDFLNAKGTLTVGQVLTILPVDGAVYTVKKGDTITSIAKKYSVASADILSYNNIASASDLRAGDTITIPGAVAPAVSNDSTTAPSDTTDANTTPAPVQPPAAKHVDLTPPVEQVAQAPAVVTQTPVDSDSTSSSADGGEGGDMTQAAPNQSQSPSTATPAASGFIWPVPLDVGRISQWLHDDDAIDLAAPAGTPIYAPADGTILLAHTSGWNGGYGLYVVENFTAGGQLLAAHMSKNISTPGEVVKQGDIIGYVGTTGSSTGNHVHLSFRGIPNPYAILKVGDTSAEYK